MADGIVKPLPEPEKSNYDVRRSIPAESIEEASWQK